MKAPTAVLLVLLIPVFALAQVEESNSANMAIPHLKRFIELAPDEPEAPAVRSVLSRIQELGSP